MPLQLRVKGVYEFFWCLFCHPAARSSLRRWSTHDLRLAETQERKVVVGNGFDKQPKHKVAPDVAHVVTKESPSQKRDSEIPVKPKPPQFSAGVGQPRVTGVLDDQGHLTGGTQTVSRETPSGAQEQVERTLTLPPFPQRTFVRLQDGNRPPFDVTLSGTATDFTIKGKNAQKGAAVTVRPTIDGRPAATLTFIDLDVNDQITNTRKIAIEKITDLQGFVESMLKNFPEYKNMEPAFHELLKAASADLASWLASEALVPVDPNTGLPVLNFDVPTVIASLGWGSFGRSVIWGLAGAGGVLIGAPAGTVAAGALAAGFLFGFDANGLCEIWTAYEQGGIGNDKDKKNKEESRDGWNK